MQIAALQSRQDVIDWKMTKVLANTTATVQAVDELKTLLTRYIGQRKGGDSESPSVSKSQLDSPLHVPPRNDQCPHVQHSAAEVMVDVDPVAPGVALAEMPSVVGTAEQGVMPLPSNGRRATLKRINRRGGLRVPHPCRSAHHGRQSSWRRAEAPQRRWFGKDCMCC
jgi:hypothetical protein